MTRLAVCALLCAVMALSDAVSYPTVPPGLLFCPCGWTQVNNRCFLYVANPMTWADAEKNCLSVNANLASVHSAEEYQLIQKLILNQSKASGLTWIGGSDAQQVFTWFWSDGTPFNYVNWHAGEPDNFQGLQKCLAMNFNNDLTWDDQNCQTTFPSVCARYIG